MSCGMAETLNDIEQRHEARYPVYSEVNCRVRIERQGDIQDVAPSGVS
jgi:hypothetical protein